jgi:hypothetical protein
MLRGGTIESLGTVERYVGKLLHLAKRELNNTLHF